MDQTRRALLRTTALAAAAGLAGCNGDGDSTDTATDGPATGETATSGTRTTTETVTDTATPADDLGVTVGQWFPPPSVAEQDDYAFVTLHPKLMAEYGDALPDARTANLDTDIALAGFDAVRSLRGLHQTGIGLTVYDGPFDRAALESQLTEAGFSSDGSYQGFDVFSADARRVVGIGDRRVATVDLRRMQVSVDAGTVLQAAIDADGGAGERYRSTDDDVAALLSALGTGHVINCQPDSTALADDAAVGQGGRWRLGSDVTSVAVAMVFESADATDPETVASWADAAGPFGEAPASVSTDGRVVLAEAEVPTGDLGPFQISTTGGGQPQVALNFDYDSDAGTVTVTHRGGDAVPADLLELRGNGFTDREGADQTSPGTWAGTASGEEGTVVAGDSVVVGVTPAYQLLVLYTPEEGSGVALGSDNGPEA